MSKIRVARFNAKSKKKNTVAAVPIKVFFQSAPGVDDAKGIGGVPYKLKIGGKDKTPANAKTKASGEISISLRKGEKAELEILGTKYEVTRSEKALLSAESTKGAQQRLQALGYHCGAVDGQKGARTERATLEFQADSMHPKHQPHCRGARNGTLDIDGRCGNNTRKALQKLIKTYKGE